ncbi:YqeG family HAD IIIA-type phosphatase [Cellulosilyticum lentocellum]|uniref:HAD superfamily (Subfamily IIIA) phosphatase, TIGR01668 n=1 Tax=Cellulosilyticum lentocellum (strain ATCC 49066 / DSM 5427 / NCIMB 11756 / RHM5) TaxID=642492 RepID=F2JMD5_CELLD|nr:YqeG family HAD IIIA-type phosphatase [Cellulosilyticum lentocellum]ADZ83453.1 HAD superfamily (subfamily IIIA) phosphatase, TIGR01668 [Cellulosilyticum lentocellum DSM 5427]
MIKKLYPTQYIQSIYEIDLLQLKKNGIRGIIFDIDNTLVPYDEVEPNTKIIDFFEMLRKNGFIITLVSNNTEDRVVKFNEKLKVFALHKSHKPLTRNFIKALRMMKCEKNEAIIVGDQIFTDVFGGNKAGIQTILVRPVSDKDEWKTKIKRGVERRIISKYEKYLEQNQYKGE